MEKPQEGKGEPAYFSSPGIYPLGLDSTLLFLLWPPPGLFPSPETGSACPSPVTTPPPHWCQSFGEPLALRPHPDSQNAPASRKWSQPTLGASYWAWGCRLAKLALKWRAPLSFDGTECCGKTGGLLLVLGSIPMGKGCLTSTEGCKRGLEKKKIFIHTSCCLRNSPTPSPIGVCREIWKET